MVYPVGPDDDMVNQQLAELPYPPSPVRSRNGFDQGLLDIEQQIQDAYEQNPALKIAFYGQPGTGKTWLAASFPDCLIIDCHEEGQKFLPKKRFPNVKVLKLKRLEQIEMAYWYLRQGKHPFKTVVIDTVSSLIEMGMNYMLIPDEESWTVSRAPAMPSQRLWGQMNANIGQLLWWFVELPLNVIFLAHERKQDTEDSLTAEDLEEIHAPMIFPDLNPGLQRRLFGAVDIMGRMVMKNVKFKPAKEGDPVRVELARVLYLKPGAFFQAKDRSDVLPSRIINPDYNKLQRYLKRLQEV